MRTIRQILLTEYIGAMVVAVLIVDCFSALLAAAAEQIAYHVYSAEHNFPRDGQRLSITYSILATLTRAVLYLISAYLLARWLYPASAKAAEARELPHDQNPGEGL